MLSTKIEVVLMKAKTVNWTSLESAAPKAPAPIQYPTSSHSGPKNWEQLSREEEEADDGGAEVGADAALTQLFQSIYKDADEDTKKAMIKSFTESGGTSLSTDWKDVRKKRVEVKPPEGMEARSYH